MSSSIFVKLRDVGGSITGTLGARARGAAFARVFFESMQYTSSSLSDDDDVDEDEDDERI